MRILFFFVHPSKFHVFRNLINHLKSSGHTVDIIISSKDVLEQLILNEGWEYKNLFPNGRKISWLPTYLSAFFNTIVTILKIEKYLFKKPKYNLFITDDLLVVNGKIRNTPSILFQDDDITAVPESGVLMYFAKHIMSPSVSNMKGFNKKKIAFYGYKELASLHPRKFKPDLNVVKKFNPNNEKYFILRLVSLRSTHDVGKKGLSDSQIDNIIEILSKKGRVFITSERPLPPKYEPYRIQVNVNHISHALYFADLLISDSQTMSAEAAVLGTPYIRYNDFVGRISYLNELENKYELGFGVKTGDEIRLFTILEGLINNKMLKSEWEAKKLSMLEEKIDLTDFMIWFFENYPTSLDLLENDLDYQKRFISTS